MRRRRRSSMQPSARPCKTRTRACALPHRARQACWNRRTIDASRRSSACMGSPTVVGRGSCRTRRLRNGGGGGSRVDIARIPHISRTLRIPPVQTRVIARVVALAARRRMVDTRIDRATGCSGARVDRTAGRSSAGVGTRRNPSMSRVVGTSSTLPLRIGRGARMRTRRAARRSILKLGRQTLSTARARPVASACGRVRKHVSPLGTRRSVSRVIALRQRSTSHLGKYAYVEMITHRLHFKPPSDITAYHLQTERALSKQNARGPEGKQAISKANASAPCAPARNRPRISK